ncbi:hypothetical protein Tco_1264795 [Tanacetum coccineum]
MQSRNSYLCCHNTSIPDGYHRFTEGSDKVDLLSWFFGVLCGYSLVLLQSVGSVHHKGNAAGIRYWDGREGGMEPSGPLKSILTRGSVGGGGGAGAWPAVEEGARGVFGGGCLRREWQFPVVITLPLLAFGAFIFAVAWRVILWVAGTCAGDSAVSRWAVMGGVLVVLRVARTGGVFGLLAGHRSGCYVDLVGVVLEMFGRLGGGGKGRDFNGVGVRVGGCVVGVVDLKLSVLHSIGLIRGELVTHVHLGLFLFSLLCRGEEGVHRGLPRVFSDSPLSDSLNLYTTSMGGDGGLPLGFGPRRRSVADCFSSWFGRCWIVKTIFLGEPRTCAVRLGRGLLGDCAEELAVGRRGTASTDLGGELRVSLATPGTVRSVGLAWGKALWLEVVMSSVGVVASSMQILTLSSNGFARKIISSSTTAIPLHFQYKANDMNSVLSWLKRWSASHCWKVLPKPKEGRRPDLKKSSTRRHSMPNVETIASEFDKPIRNMRKVSSTETANIVEEENPELVLERIKRNLRKVNNHVSENTFQTEPETKKESTDNNTQNIATVLFEPEIPREDETVQEVGLMKKETKKPRRRGSLPVNQEYTENNEPPQTKRSLPSYMAATVSAKAS